MIERPQWYVYQFSNPNLAVGAQELGKALNLDSDAPFRATGVAVYCYGPDGSTMGPVGNIGVTLRFAVPDRTFCQKNLISAQQLNPLDIQALGGAGGEHGPFYSYFSPLTPNIIYPAGSTIQVDFAELPGVKDSLVLVVFIGTKLFGDGSIWAPQRNPKRPARPYIGYSLQFQTSDLPVRNLQLAVTPDADFAWQCGSQTDQPLTPGVSGQQRGVAVKIKDWTGKYYMNDYVPADMIFGFDNSQTPGTFYPEIYIPRQQSIYFDLKAVP